jgi:NAD(P)-dependent dehydrogenase (short-subunit alcohol dehydrogenase family)
MSELRFDGRVAVITGAGSGLGASHARLLAARGAAVVVNDVDAGAADAVVDALGEGRAAAHHGDISTEDGAGSLVATALDRFGRVDVVVNNAGILRSAPFAEMTADLWDRIVAINLRGTFLVTHAAWPHFVGQGFGRIVSTTSNSGLLGIPGSSAYASAKAALWGLTRTLALEGAELGINVNAIAPMAYTRLSAASKVAPESWRTGEGDAWSRRLDVAQVSAAVAWLAHADCLLTGQILTVAGGHVGRFALHVNTGFDRDQLTPEDVRDNEADLLDGDGSGPEYRAAADEARDLHRRLMRGQNGR